MTESKDLKRRAAAEGPANSGQESGQEVPEGQSKGERQLPIYQSDWSLRDAQANAVTKRRNQRKPDQFYFNRAVIVPAPLSSIATETLVY